MMLITIPTMTMVDWLLTSVKPIKLPTTHTIIQTTKGIKAIL